jgi:hypothetical protein
MTNPDYRALCANLTAALNDWQCRTDDDGYAALIDCARAALAQPEPARQPTFAELYVLPSASTALAQPEPVAPTDKELMDLAEEVWVPFAKSQPHPQGHPWDLILARAVLARWGTLAAQPVPVSERWPEFSDCNSFEEVWAFNPVLDHWKLTRINRSIHTHWLPHWVLPVPTPANNTREANQ